MTSGLALVALWGGYFMEWPWWLQLLSATFGIGLGLFVMNEYHYSTTYGWLRPAEPGPAPEPQVMTQEHRAGGELIVAEAVGYQLVSLKLRTEDAVASKEETRHSYAS